LREAAHALLRLNLCTPLLVDIVMMIKVLEFDDFVVFIDFEDQNKRRINMHALEFFQVMLEVLIVLWVLADLFHLLSVASYRTLSRLKSFSGFS
jgi:hypothetical protein